MIPLGFIVGPGHGTITGCIGGPLDGQINQGPMALRPHEVFAAEGYEIVETRVHADDGTVCYVHTVWGSIAERGAL